MRRPSLNDLLIMSYLAKNPDSNGEEIAFQVGVNVDSIPCMLHRLRDKELVIAKRSEHNGNERLYSLSQRGAENLQDFQDLVKRFL